MKDLVTFLRFVPATCVFVIGLVLAVALRRRLGRVAALAICAFTTLSVANFGSVTLFIHVSNVLPDAATPAKMVEIIDLADRVQSGLDAASVVGFALLLAAVLTGPGRTVSAIAMPPPDPAEAP